MPVTWGILSTARINELVLSGARRSDRVEMVAVASRDAARADAYAREYGLERAYASYDELLADPDIEAVYVSLPNAFHVEWSIRALEAGKHVLCEKPLSRNPEEVEQAFHVTINDYRDSASGRTFYANENDPCLPAEVAPYVQAIVGLNNLAVPRRG